ncbi:MAG: hypothetical protein U9N63_01865 [Pseudomonadota bacterium]|nr:hypothetical protein [Pseudomonadota bacterium]
MAVDDEFDKEGVGDGYRPRFGRRENAGVKFILRNFGAKVMFLPCATINPMVAINDMTGAQSKLINLL